MEKNLAEVFLDFYQKTLKPEFDAINGNLARHDERLSEISGRLDAISDRLERLEQGEKKTSWSDHPGDEQVRFLKAAIESNP